MEIRLEQNAPDGLRIIEIAAERTTLGRGTDASERFDDNGLSRLNSTLYSEGDRVWIVDEGSTNGTFVNGEKVPPSGTPLTDGDRIKIGTSTELTVKFGPDPAQVQAEAQAAAAAASIPAAAPLAPEARGSMLPVILIAAAIVVISVSAVVVAFTVFGDHGTNVAALGQNDPSSDDPESDRPSRETPTPTASSNGSTTTATPSDPGTSTPDNSTLVPTATPSGPQLPDKKYSDMTDAEKRQYVESHAMRIAAIIGNSSSDKIPPPAVDKIKSFLDAYVSRTHVKPLSGCRFGDNLEATYTRASKDAPFILSAFNEKGIDPRIGLYLAMIESEHCICLQSPTGPLGMFQFTKATAQLHGLNVFAGASPSNPDERCQPEPAARAAASYMKALLGRYGTGPASVPLAIGSYNSGEGGLSSNLEKALSTGTGLPRDFWTLIEKGDMLSKQFQAENFKYVPKFFAAAIIGEYPKDFGLNLNPISSYSK